MFASPVSFLLMFLGFLVGLADERVIEAERIAELPTTCFEVRLVDLIEGDIELARYVATDDELALDLVLGSLRSFRSVRSPGDV